MDRLSILFRNAHALAKHCRPFNDFEWMLDADEKKGLKVGSTYRNDKQCKNFIQCIARVERKKIEEEIRMANFISVLSDGSTDVSVTENEIVYVRICREGEVKVFFVGLIAVAKANAAGILSAIRKALEFEDLTKEEVEQKLIGFGADGASVNTGKNSGVISRMRDEISSEIVLLRCLAHALELAFKDTFKNCKLYDKLISLLQELFKFYHKSALQKSELQDAFDELEMISQQPHRIGGTRWVPHILSALEQLWKGYRGYLKHLKKVSFSNKNNFILRFAKYI